MTQQLRHSIGSSLQFICNHPVVLSILGIGALWSLSFEGFGRLWQYHLLHTFTFPSLGNFAPVVWFGIIEIVIALTNILGIEVAKRHVATTSHRSVAWALVLVNSATLVGVVSFALAGEFGVALGALWLITTANGPQIPLMQAWLNQHLAPGLRATVFSMTGQMNALVALLGGPLIGIVATMYSTQLALLLTGLLLVPSLLLVTRTLRSDT